MDHSYRQAQGAPGRNAQGGGYGRPRFDAQRFHQPTLPDPEPLPPDENGATRILAMVDDLFFVSKIQETARKLNVKVEFTKTDKEILERIEANGQEKPSLIIIDLNSVSAKPLTTIPKLKAKLKKETSILGFVSHVQGDLKVKAQEAGCDAVMPRSAFSQNLPQLLRRHGAPEDLSQNSE
jgi:CheY-like chemotaxis protein